MTEIQKELIAIMVKLGATSITIEGDKITAEYQPQVIRMIDGEPYQVVPGVPPEVPKPTKPFDLGGTMAYAVPVDNPYEIHWEGDDD
jgi:hypothetical protein